MLEEQLQRSRKRSELVMDLESEIIKYKQKLNDMASERDADKTRLQGKKKKIKTDPNDGHLLNFSLLLSSYNL